MSFPTFSGVVLDTTDARGLAEFYRQLLGWSYRDGDEMPPPGEPDERGADWLVILGSGRLGFQQVRELAPATWPDGPTPQQLHLDFTVADVAELAAQDARARALGAVVLEDRADDPVEPLRVYADPAGHPFCLYVPSRS